MNLDKRINDILYNSNNNIKLITLPEYVKLNKSILTDQMQIMMLYEYDDLLTKQIYYNAITYHSAIWTDNFLIKNDVDKLFIKPVNFSKIINYYFYPIDDLLYIMYSYNTYSLLEINCFMEHKMYNVFQYSIKLHKLPQTIIYQKLNKKRRVLNDLAKIPLIKDRVNYEIFIEKFKQFYPLLKSRILLNALHEQ